MPRLPDLADLSRWPVIVAPMGGDRRRPTWWWPRPRAGAVGFLAAGYKTAEAMAAEIKAVQTATATAVTRAFSGRPARGLVNRFMLAHPDAPPAYPEINNATRPLRAAAAAQADAGGMSLWAGQAFRAAAVRAAGEIVEYLARPV
jgi:nitronate monooxygenase